MMRINTSVLADEDIYGELLLEEINAAEVRALFPLIFIYAFLLIIGVFGNSLVLLVYLLRYKQSPARVYILFLAAIDFSICLFGLPYHLIDLTHPYTYNDALSCQVLTFFIGSFFHMSIFGLIVIAIDRYLKICRPLSVFQMTYFGKKRACFIAVVTAVALSWPYLVLYGPSEMETLQGNMTGHSCFFHTHFLETPYPFIYTLITLSICVGSVIFLSVAYILICHNIIVRYKDLIKPSMNAAAEDTFVTEEYMFKNGTSSTPVRSSPALSMERLNIVNISAVDLKVLNGLDQSFQAQVCSLKSRDMTTSFSQEQNNTRNMKLERNCFDNICNEHHEGETNTTISDTNVGSSNYIRKEADNKNRLTNSKKKYANTHFCKTNREKIKYSESVEIDSDSSMSNVGISDDENDIDETLGLIVDSKIETSKHSKLSCEEKTNTEREEMNYKETQDTNDSSDDAVKLLSGECREHTEMYVLKGKSISKPNCPLPSMADHTVCKVGEVTGEMSKTDIRSNEINNQCAMDETQYSKLIKSVCQQCNRTFPHCDTCINTTHMDCLKPSRSAELSKVKLLERRNSDQIGQRVHVFHPNHKSKSLMTLLTPSPVIITPSNCRLRVHTNSWKVSDNHSIRSSVKLKPPLSRQHYKITKIMLTVTIVFILSYAPALAVTICSVVDPSFWDELTEQETIVCELLLRLYVLNNICNPFIYGFWDRRFKREVILSLRRVKRYLLSPFRRSR